jgi:hypothetical protein
VALGAPFYISSVYPNPIAAHGQISLVVDEEQFVQVSLFSADGRRAALLYEGILTSASPRVVVINAESLASGVYFIRVAGEKFVASRTLVRMK